MFQLLDLIAPKWSETSLDFNNYLSPHLSAQAKLQNFNFSTKDKQILDKINYIYSYTGDIKELIHRAKFDGEWAIMTEFADLISKLLSELDLKNTAITYIPFDPKRQGQRGYHTPQILASKIAYNLALDCLDLLLKPNSTIAQVKLKRKERLANLNKAFIIKDELPNSLTRYDKIIIIDDIVTTSTTLNMAAKIIKTKFPFLKIEALVIAH